jgi:hypothetical protein
MKIKQTVLLFALLIGFGGVIVAPVVNAAGSCAGVKTSIITCDGSRTSDLGSCDDGSYPNNGQCNLGKCGNGLNEKPVNGACTSGATFIPPIPSNGECVKDKTKPKKDWENAGPVTYDNNNKPKCAKGDYVAPATYKNAPSIEKTGIWLLLIIAINIITYGIGLAGVVGIVWGAMLYTTASGKPEQVKKANMVIANTLLGMIVYAAAYAFMNFIIPGGLFG